MIEKQKGKKEVQRNKKKRFFQDTKDDAINEVIFIALYHKINL
jgi:hypothetical protein